MTQLEKVQYTAKAQTTGGRNGASDGDDRHRNVEHFSPSTQVPAPTRRISRHLSSCGCPLAFCGSLRPAMPRR